MGAYNAVLDTLVTEAPKIRRNPAESGGFRRIVDHTYYVLALPALRPVPPMPVPACPVLPAVSFEHGTLLPASGNIVDN